MRQARFGPSETVGFIIAGPGAVRSGRTFPPPESRLRAMSLLTHTACLAVESGSTSLDPDLKDAWGLPALRLTFRNHPEDLTFSGHLMGSCRMGNDPRASVIGKNHRTPDCTIAALACRAAAGIVRSARGREI